MPKKNQDPAMCQHCLAEAAAQAQQAGTWGNTPEFMQALASEVVRRHEGGFCKKEKH